MNQSTALIETSQAGTLTIRDDDRHAQAAGNYLANLSPGSRRTMTQSLAAISDILLRREPGKSAEENRRRVDEFRWGALRAEHVSAIRAHLVNACEPGPDGGKPAMSVATANKGLVALRKVLFEGWKLGLIEREEYERAIAFERIKGEREQKGRGVTDAEILRLVVKCEEDTSPLAARDGAILAILFYAGLRRFELAALRLSDWDAEKQQFKVRFGKGKKSRLVPVPDGVAVALERWLAVRAGLLAEAGVETDVIVFGLTKGHRARVDDGRVRPMTTDAIFKALVQMARRAGIESFTPHDGRRTYLSSLLDAGVDLATVQKLAGHADPKTTAAYDRRGLAARQAAARKLNAPFTRRA